MIYTIDKWLGVNESGDKLGMGEARIMRNIKITDDFSPQKRPGTNVVASLFAANTVVAGDDVVVKTDLNTASSTFTVYPTSTVTTGGVIEPSGTSVTMNYANHNDYTDYIYKSPENVVYKFVDCVLTQPTGVTPVSGGYVSIGELQTIAAGGWMPGMSTPTFMGYSSVMIRGGVVMVAGTYGELSSSHPYISLEQRIYKFDRLIVSEPVMNEYDIPVYGMVVIGSLVTNGGDDQYKWTFKPLTLSPTTGTAEVRALWSGVVNSTEYIVAACNSHLWSLSEADGVWTKTDLGSITTTGKVGMFGFDNKLYVLTGAEYKVWTGSGSISDVSGYEPLVASEVPPAGGGTARQRINMLTAKRKIWVSPNGSAATFTLPEKGIASVDYAKVIATGAALTISSSDLAAGTTTLSAAPASGTNTVEIGYTAATTPAAALRAQVVAMRYAELYNGVNDNRIFFYGDNTNKAFYSDLDYNGLARADYIPDLNVIKFGDNSPITSMVRHYDRLLVFKSNSAYSVSYDSITLVSGTATAGFYISPVNRSVGSTGQAVVVENNPRTLDSRSIHEWTAVGTNNEQRSENVISQKVKDTLLDLDFTKAMMYYDKVNHEFYVVENGIAIVQNLNNKAWYIYRSFPAVCMVVYKDELYFGTAEGTIRHVSRIYKHDIGNAIDCYIESGDMDFNKPFVLKYSDQIWITIDTEPAAELGVRIQTNKKESFNTVYVYAGLFSYDSFDYSHVTYSTVENPQTTKKKFKAKDFTSYKLIFESNTDDTTFTLLDASVIVRETGMVK